MAKILKKIKRFFRFFDLYGQNVNLYINKSSKFKSWFSGLISLGILIFICYFFAPILKTWMNQQTLITIPATVNYSVKQLIQENKPYEYDISYKNFYVNFIIKALLPNGTTLINEELKSYITFRYVYDDIFSKENLLDYEICNVKKENIFLGLDEQENSDSIENGNDNENNPNRLCIANSFKMKIVPDIEKKKINSTQFFFQIYKCENSSSNSNSCATNEEISNIIKYIEIQAYIPKTIYDFQNVLSPKTRIYDLQIFTLEQNIKIYNYSLVPTLLYTDQGWINEDYFLDQTDFNGNIASESFRVNENQNLLFRYNFLIGYTFQIYYRRNQKINEVIGSFGGIINVIFLLGKIICATHNMLTMKILIIRRTFLKLSNDLSPLDNSKNIKSKKFRCFSYFFPSKESRIFYENGFKKLYEYIDIRNIIKRLQDLDKLKLVLLDDKQRKLFECIPKPDICIKSKGRFSLDHVLKYKRNDLKRITTKLPFFFDAVARDKNNPVNERILNLIEPQMKKKLEKKFTRIRYGFFSIFSFKLNIIKIIVLIKDNYHQNEGNIPIKIEKTKLIFNSPVLF